MIILEEGHVSGTTNSRNVDGTAKVTMNQVTDCMGFLSMITHGNAALWLFP